MRHVWASTVNVRMKRSLLKGNKILIISDWSRYKYSTIVLLFQNVNSCSEFVPMTGCKTNTLRNLNYGHGQVICTTIPIQPRNRTYIWGGGYNIQWGELCFAIEVQIRAKRFIADIAFTVTLITEPYTCKC